MINRPYQWLAITLCWLAFSCAGPKKAIVTVPEYTLLDTVEVVASKEQPYRASATRENDILHTKLEVSFDYSRQQMGGRATLQVKPYFYPTQSLTLDAKGMQINEVLMLKSNGIQQTLNYTYDSLQLHIQLDRQYVATEEYTIQIRYVSRPNERSIGGSAAISQDKGLYFINPLGKEQAKPTQIWTQGETESNSTWFPTIDKPNEKMTNEIFIKHDKKYTSLSNGLLKDTKDNGDGTVTDHWVMDLPHAPYLVMMAIGEFAVVKETWRNKAVDYYVEPAYQPYAKEIFGNTPEMLEFYSQLLGVEYPWQKYAQVVVRDYVSGAMENTSATLHSEILQRSHRELIDETNEDIIAHELFHQWFGDYVTCESWSNIPLNESFATYGEFLWNEYKYGSTYADWKRNVDINTYLSAAKSKNVDLIRFHYDDKEDMFDRHSYQKGGCVLHMLRKTVGDKAFFQSLQLYLKSNAFKPVEIHQLRLAFEEVTGQDLNWFFNQWFMNSGHPILDISYSQTTDSVFVNISQKQNSGKGLIYKLPTSLTIYYNNKTENKELVITKKSERFGFAKTGEVLLMDVDSGRALLCERNENKQHQTMHSSWLHPQIL